MMEGVEGSENYFTFEKGRFVGDVTRLLIFDEDFKSKNIKKNNLKYKNYFLRNKK